MKLRFFVPLALISVMFAACGEQVETGSEEQETSFVSGSVTYRERIALSDDAVVVIELQDVSRQDTRANVIARQRITRPGQVPIDFEIPFDPADIDGRLSYAVSASITEKGRLLFVTDTHVPVLTRGSGNQAELVLIGVRSPGFGTMKKPRRKSTPEQIGSGFEMKGMFRYLADAPLFRDCSSNRSFPVAMEGAYKELESAYLNSGIEPGSEIMVQIVGRRMERPAMEGNSNEVNVIVDVFKQILPENSCTAMSQASLTDTYWKLLELDGRAVVTPQGMKEAHLVLASAGFRAHGNAGCNRFFGQYEAGEDTLSFSPLGSTMMACPEGMDTERDFLAALGATAAYRISGEILELLAERGEAPLARLESVYL